MAIVSIDDLGALSPDERAIADIEFEMATAQTAQGVSRSWDDSMVWFDIQPGTFADGVAARSHFAEQMEAIENIRTKILELEIHADGALGYAISKQNFISNVKGSDAQLDFIFRETDVFRLIDGHWRIVHQHISIPVDFSNGQGVMKSDA